MKFLYSQHLIQMFLEFNINETNRISKIPLSKSSGKLVYSHIIYKPGVIWHLLNRKSGSLKLHYSVRLNNSCIVRSN